MHAAFLALWALPAYLLFKLVQHIRTNISNARKARQLGCKPPPTFPGLDFLGVKPIFELARESKTGTELLWFMRIFESASEVHGRHVHTVQGQLLRIPMLVTRDPKNVQALLATQFKDFELGTTRLGTFGPLLGKGIFSSDGKQWEHSRALLRPQFSRGQISDLDLEEEHVQNLLQAVPTNAYDNWTDTVDMCKLFYRLTMDSATEFLFGESAGTQLIALRDAGESGEFRRHREFTEAFDRAQDAISDAIRLGEYWSWGITRQYKKDSKVVHEYIDAFVQKALSIQGREKEKKKEKEGGRYIFLEQLADRTSDPVEIRDQLLSILVAGRDTTAGLLSFLFLTLSRKPAEFEKLRATILENFGTLTETISFDTLKNCQYLQWCLNEGLRLYPSVPGNSRRSTRDTTLPRGGGADGMSPIFVPKDTEVNYTIYATHRAEEFWGKDADEFRPERWDGRRAGFDFLPFNAGPRICLGQQFALTQAAYVTVRLLQNFDKLDGSAHTGDINRWMLTLTGRPKDGTKLRLHKATA